MEAGDATDGADVNGAPVTGWASDLRGQQYDRTTGNWRVANFHLR